MPFIFAAGAAILSLGGPVPLAIGIAAASYLSVKRLIEDPPIAGFAAATFSFGALFFGERGMLAAWTIAVMSGFVTRVLRSQIKGSAQATADLAAGSAVGFLLAYFVLLRDGPDGHRLILALVVITVLFETGLFLSRRLPEAFHIPIAAVAGVLGSALTTIFLEPPFDLDSMLVLGIATSLACALGAAVLRLVERGRLAPFALAAPVFYYGFRLLLT